MENWSLRDLSIIEKIPAKERVTTAEHSMNLKRGFMENTYLEKDITTEEYDKEPVFYCSHCLSLKIKSLDAYIDYCDNCGCTDIETTDIFTWRKMYKERFGKEF